MQIGKIAKALMAIIAGATVLYFATTSYFARDPQYKAAEDFLRRSPEVQSVVGTVEAVNMRRYVSVQASDVSGAYRLYDFMIKGDKARANVVVRATPKGAPPTDQFSIDSLDR